MEAARELLLLHHGLYSSSSSSSSTGRWRRSALVGSSSSLSWAPVRSHHPSVLDVCGTFKVVTQESPHRSNSDPVVDLVPKTAYLKELVPD
jgi:hypothetical protein